jgi:putative methionine-R-sulfoxide reductase with GAF domain
MEPLGTKPARISWEPNPITPDRRRRVRHKVHTPAYASLDGSSGGRDLNAILDISEEGIAIQTSSPVAPGRSLNLCLDLSETKTYIHTNGHVIWSDGSGRTGIHIPDLPDASLRQLKEWISLNTIAGGANQAAEPIRQPKPEAWQKTTEGTTVRPASLPQEDEVEPPIPPDYTSILAALAAAKREVEAVGADLDAALHLVAERAQTFTRATGAAIALSQGAEMICVASAGPDAPGPGAKLQIGSGFSGECVRTGMLLGCDDSETDPRVDRESCRVLGIRSMIAVPIRLGGTVVGLLEVFSAKPNAFDTNDHTILQRLAETILAAVNRAARLSAKANSVQKSAQPAADTLTSNKSLSRSGGPLLIVVAATLFLALAWLAVPWVESWIDHWSRASSQPDSKKTLVAPAKPPVSTVADASDLGALRRLAERGDPAAQFALGARYATGEEVPQDYSEAVRWFTLAADQGHVVAQQTLGAYYWAGRGVNPDLSKAYFWSILAQAGGDEASKYRAAILASRMSRGQLIAAQQQANDWLKQHQLASSKPAPAR